MATSGFFLCRFSGIFCAVSCAVFCALRGFLRPVRGATVRYLKKILLGRQKKRARDFVIPQFYP